MAGPRRGTPEPLRAGGRTARWSRIATLLLAGGQIPGCTAYPGPTGHEPVRIGDERPLFTALAFAPDSRSLAAANTLGGVTRFDLDTGVGRSVPIQWRGGGEYRPQGTARQLSYSPDGKWLAAAGFDAKVMVWHVDRMQEFRTFGTFLDATSIAFSPDSRYLAMGSRRGSIRVVDLDGDAATVGELGAGAPVSCLAFRADGRSLVAGTYAGQLHLWRWSSDLPEATFETGDPVTDCAIRDTDRRLLALSGAAVLAWDLAAPGAPGRADLDAPETVAEQLVRYGIVYPVVTAAILLALALGGGGGGLPLEAVFADLDPMAVSPDGARVAVVMEQPGVRRMYGPGFTQLLDLSSGEVIATLARDDSADLAFSPDGRYVALTGRYGLRVYDTHKAHPVSPPRARESD